MKTNEKANQVTPSNNDFSLAELRDAIENNSTLLKENQEDYQNIEEESILEYLPFILPDNIPNKGDVITVTYNNVATPAIVLCKAENVNLYVYVAGEIYCIYYQHTKYCYYDEIGNEMHVNQYDEVGTLKICDMGDISEANTMLKLN